jgi:hypothetical protein
MRSTGSKIFTRENCFTPYGKKNNGQLFGANGVSHAYRFVKIV